MRAGATVRGGYDEFIKPLVDLGRAIIGLTAAVRQSAARSSRFPPSILDCHERGSVGLARRPAPQPREHQASCCIKRMYRQGRCGPCDLLTNCAGAAAP